MKELETQFKAGGFEFSQLKREGDIALYKRNRTGSEHSHFEVIRIRSHDGYEIHGNKIAPAEIYPSPAKWGSDGFTYLSTSAAEKRFQELVCACTVSPSARPEPKSDDL